MKEKTYSSAAWIKFLAFSALGIFIFFININIGGSKNVPMLHIINIVKGKVPPNANMWLVTLICLFTLVTSLWARLPGAPQWIRNHHAKDNIFSYFTYITAAIFSLMVTLNVGPVFIIDPVVGASSVNVARDVIYSVVIAGALVVFLTEFGLLEFIGTLMEPIMRKCFRVPGKSSIDALSSFVCSPAVGVMITSSLYKGKIYTQREAVTITTSFSVCSLGAFAFLSGMANCSEYYSVLILSSLVLVFIMAAIMVRIPPISKKKDVYIDGEAQTPELLGLPDVELIAPSVLSGFFALSLPSTMYEIGIKEVCVNGENPLDGFIYKSFVEEFLGPNLFDYGYGPFRWVCLSGSPEDLRRTDQAAMACIDKDRRYQDYDNYVWIRDAEKNRLVIGTQAHILYQDARTRGQIALKFNEMVRRVIQNS